MNDLQEIHNKAMDLAEMAEVAKIKGDLDSVERLQIEAFLLESEAANKLKDHHDVEPTRSVLYRSAASLAMECRKWKDAEKLIVTGLQGKPPEEIANEMRELWEQINYAVRLEGKQIALENNDLSFSVQGREVGFGIAPFNIVMDRLQNFEKLIFRTIDRMINEPYREAGQSKYSTKYPLFMKASLPGSFMVTLTIGQPFQKKLPGFDELDMEINIIDEIMACIELIDEMNEDALKERISDPAYFNNFVSLVNQMAPDGDSVKRVDFFSRNRMVSLDRKRSEIAEIRKIEPIENKESGKTITINGLLLYADAIKEIETGTIKILDREHGKTYTIIVPSGMDDIVSTLWSKWVTASIIQIGKVKHLNNIQPHDQEEILEY